jgi:AraC family transcriptional regulator
MPIPHELSFLSKNIDSGRYYVVDLTPRDNSPLAVVRGGREQCNPTYVVNRSDFRFHAIELVVWGQGSLQLNGTIYALTPGTLFRYGPGVSHLILTVGAKSLERCFVEFVGQDVQNLFDDAWSGAAVLRVSDLLRAQNRFEDLSRVGSHQGPNTARLAALILEQLVLETGNDRLSDDAQDSASHQTYLRCRAYLDKHYLSLRSLAEFASACHLTDTYACRLFQRYEGCSPYRVMLQLKMAHAATMLRDPAVSVKRAGLHVGFDDPYHFSKAFKQVLGVPPKVLRDGSR